jgi:hypothetical protein
VTDQTTLSAEEEARHVKNPYAPYCLWDSEPWPCSVSRLLDAARERPSVGLDALAEALRPLFDGPEPTRLETLGWVDERDRLLALPRLEIARRVHARLTETDAGEGTGWREASRRLHESGDDEPYATDTTEATLRADVEAADPVGDLAAKLVPMFADGLVDVPGERRIEDKAFALAHALRAALQQPAVEGGPE